MYYELPKCYIIIIFAFFLIRKVHKLVNKYHFVKIYTLGNRIFLIYNFKQ